MSTLSFVGYVVSVLLFLQIHQAKEVIVARHYGLPLEMQGTMPRPWCPRLCKIVHPPWDIDAYFTSSRLRLYVLGNAIMGVIALLLFVMHDVLRII